MTARFERRRSLPDARFQHRSEYHMLRGIPARPVKEPHRVRAMIRRIWTWIDPPRAEEKELSPPEIRKHLRVMRGGRSESERDGDGKNPISHGRWR